MTAKPYVRKAAAALSASVPALSRQRPQGRLASGAASAATSALALRFAPTALPLSSGAAAWRPFWGVRTASSSSSGPLQSDAVNPDREEVEEPPKLDEEQDVEDDLVKAQVRVYRRDKEEHQRIFRWGVGNSFRMIAANRFTPVHKPHPKEVCVRNDYYESENPNIIWEELNESWEVYWYENNKLTARPFPVKKFGVERAKREAYAFYEQLGKDGRLHEKKKIESPQPGVFFDERLQDWICFFPRGNHRHSRAYSVTKYGFEGAQKLAVAKQNDPVNGLLHHRKGRAPVIPFRKQRKALESA